jgi:hypothetical protein
MKNFACSDDTLAFLLRLRGREQVGSALADGPRGLLTACGNQERIGRGASRRRL